MHEKNEVKILVDHITFTLGRDCFLHDHVDPDDWDDTEKGILQRLQDIFHLTELEFTNRGGLNGYAIGWTHCNQINLCWGGNCDTIMVQISGKGCRLYETLQTDTGFDWLNFIRSIQKYRRHNFSRLDIACDTFGTLDIDKILRFTWEERFVSRFNDHSGQKGNKIREAIFGSPTSRMLLRIYDKTMERKREVDDATEVPEDWIRLEFQFRNEACDSFIRTWCSTKSISKTYFGIMSNQLRFVNERIEGHVDRSEVTSWWRKFLSNADRIPMAYQGGLDYNLQSLQRYLFGQAGSSIKAWLELNDYDVDKLTAMVRFKKLNERQKNLINTTAAVKNVGT